MHRGVVFFFFFFFLLSTMSTFLTAFARITTSPRFEELSSMSMNDLTGFKITPPSDPFAFTGDGGEFAGAPLSMPPYVDDPTINGFQPPYCVFPTLNTPPPPSYFSTPNPPELIFPAQPPPPPFSLSAPNPPDLIFPAPPPPPRPPTYFLPPVVYPPPTLFVPGPPVFLPPVVYPHPTTPPPPSLSTTAALWCVAKPTVPDPIIQEAMDYACGSGADCDAIKSGGSCFQPDTLLAHASFAFNSYWQRTKVAGGTCDFGGTAMLVTMDPSYDGCHFFFN